MSILENSLLAGIFLVVNLASFVLFILSYLLKEYRTSFYAMLTQMSVNLLYFFLASVKGDIFLLSVPQDFTANLIYLISVFSSCLNAIFGLKMFHQHRVVSAIIIQLGIFFSGVMMLTQISDSAYNYYIHQKINSSLEEKPGFNQTRDFDKKEIKQAEPDSSSL
jgi:hypothetical protein